jgi:hypothetical protein
MYLSTDNRKSNFDYRIPILLLGIAMIINSKNFFLT